MHTHRVGYRASNNLDSRFTALVAFPAPSSTDSAPWLLPSTNGFDASLTTTDYNGPRPTAPGPMADNAWTTQTPVCRSRSTYLHDKPGYRCFIDGATGRINLWASCGDDTLADGSHVFIVNLTVAKNETPWVDSIKYAPSADVSLAGQAAACSFGKCESVGRGRRISLVAIQSRLHIGAPVIRDALATIQPSVLNTSALAPTPSTAAPRLSAQSA
ncbi:hypothetical protein BJ912DRAFT_1060488 [Pholiota molesta]|nr:hypothetical protein BJ912DRAFT_1060488 [Pholiota molesta]